MESGRTAFSDEKYARGKERLQPFKLELFRRIHPPGPGGRALDIGCATGVISEKLTLLGFDVIGLDISPNAISQYCASGMSGMVANIEHPLPFLNHTFDMIWASEVIEHIVDYEQLLKELHRILKPGGRLYLTCPNSVFWSYRLLYLAGKAPTQLQHPYHLRFFSPAYLSKVLRQNDFEIELGMGQNVYGYIPCDLLSFIGRFSEKVSRLMERLITSMGFRRVEGLIHGDKFLFYRFSSFFYSIFSNVIMVIARAK